MIKIILTSFTLISCALFSNESSINLSLQKIYKDHNLKEILSDHIKLEDEISEKLNSSETILFVLGDDSYKIVFFEKLKQEMEIMFLKMDEISEKLNEVIFELKQENDEFTPFVYTQATASSIVNLNYRIEKINSFKNYVFERMETKLKKM